MDDEVLFRCLTGRASAREEAAVEEWRRASPLHQERYEELARVLALAVDADAQRGAGVPPVADIISRAEAVARQAQHGSTGQSGTGRRLVRWAVGTAAAAALVALTSVFWWSRVAGGAGPEPSVREIVTGRSETATVTLKDGSVVHLGPESKLQVTPGETHGLALEGHAYFAVAKQKSGPLEIKTPAGDVKVVGTRFDLEATGAGLRLTVVEGRVVLASDGAQTEVSAGQQARIVQGMRLPVVEVPVEDLWSDWLGNFLAFQNTPLRDAAREIERQFHVRVAITDSTLGEQTITAWFSGWTLAEVVDVVCVVTGAQCTMAGGVVTMRPRHSRIR